MSSTVRKIVFDAMEEGKRLNPEMWGSIIEAAVSRLQARAKAGDFGEVEAGDRRKIALTLDEIRTAIDRTANEVGMSSDPRYHAEILAGNLQEMLGDRGEGPKLIYIVKQNTDLIEGKGTMTPRGYFASEAAAYEYVMTKLSTDMGGKKSASIEEQFVAESVEEWLEADPKSRKVWGYRKGWDGHWTEGWVDNRDAPTADPEFKEYQRLKKKFEGLS